LWHFSGAKAGDSRHLLVALGDRLKTARDLVGRDLYFNLARAIRVQRRGRGMVILKISRGVAVLVCA
jgi:hypothetical protein